MFICLGFFFYFQFDSLSDQINVLLKWCFCKTGKKEKSCRLCWNSWDCPVTNLHFSVSVSTRNVSKARMGWANTKTGSVQPRGKETHLDPSPASLCWECRELKPSGNNFYTLQVQPCFTVKKSYQPLIDWPLPTQILIWDVCPHQVSTWEMGGIGSKKYCLVSHKLPGYLFYKRKRLFYFFCSQKGKEKWIPKKNISHSVKKTDGYIGMCIE